MTSEPSSPAPHLRRKAVELSAFLDRVRIATQARGLTQAELARRLEVGGATVSEWFTRGRIPSGDVIVRLPGVLRVNGHWLLTGEGPQDLPLHGVDPYQHGVRDAFGAVGGSLEELRRRFGLEPWGGGEKEAGDGGPPAR